MYFFYSNLQLLACNGYNTLSECTTCNPTSDRNPTILKQREDQMDDQVGMFDRYARKSVNLPVVDDRDDLIFCQRLVNEALFELDHHGTEPVYINAPMKAYDNSFNVKALPMCVVRFEWLDKLSEDAVWNKKS